MGEAGRQNTSDTVGPPKAINRSREKQVTCLSSNCLRNWNRSGLCSAAMKQVNWLNEETDIESHFPGTTFWYPNRTFSSVKRKISMVEGGEDRVEDGMQTRPIAFFYVAGVTLTSLNLLPKGSLELRFVHDFALICANCF